MKTLAELLENYPPALGVTAAKVAEKRAAQAQPRTLIVLDDDPTGTQSVADLPVITSWATEDLEWALQTGAPAVYVMTNSRSLGPEQARKRNIEVVRAAALASENTGIDVEFISRGDSTLRGHYPLEPQTISGELTAIKTRYGAEGRVAPPCATPTDITLIVPAFGDAGRVTIGGIHYAGSPATGYLPVGQTEFARDATFGYANSNLASWVEEKSGGTIAADNVVHIDLGALRQGPQTVAETLRPLSGNTQVTCDIACEEDLRVLSLAVLELQNEGKRFVHRVGPPFARALIGQAEYAPLESADITRLREGGNGQDAAHGLIVVGSHVAVTTRQLTHLRQSTSLPSVEIDAATVISDEGPQHIKETIGKVTALLAESNVIVQTSRELVKGVDADDSLRIARAVSDAMVAVVKGVLAAKPLRFVVAKGGITSSDTATRGLEIRRATVAGPMLPGIVSLWEPADGPARKIPYIVFAGNVGGDTSLTEVVDKLTAGV